MKKKIAALVCAAALCLAMPSMAFAANSEVVPSPDQSGSTTAQISVNGADSSLIDIHATTSDEPVYSNIPSTQTVLGSYTVEYYGTDFGGGTLTVNVGTQYAGQTATVYIVHENGNEEVYTTTVTAAGLVVIDIQELSTYTVTVAASSNGSGTTTKTNTSSTSPATGVDLTGAAGASAAAVFVGAGVVVALRKKVNE